MAKESKLESELTEYARQLGVGFYKTVSPGLRGWPDRTAVGPGGVIFIELKAPGKKPRAEQEKVHRMLRDHGADVRVVDNLGDGEGALEDVVKSPWENPFSWRQAY